MVRSFLIFAVVCCFLGCTPLHRSYHAVRFTGGGIYFWWQAGAASYLLEHHDLQSTQLIGASAGSISAALLLAKADFRKAADIAINQVEALGLRKNPTGLAGVWGPLLQDFLEQLILPSTITSEDLKRIHIAATPRQIFRGTTYLNDFATKEELIHAVLVSTHIPFFMNGKPWKSFKGKKYIDGSFWSFVLNRKPALPPSLLLSREFSTSPSSQHHYPLQQSVVEPQSAPASAPSSPHSKALTGIPHSLNLPSDDFYLAQSQIQLPLEDTLNNSRHHLSQEILDVDFQKDLILKERMKGVHFVNLISPEILYQMMDMGYDYMKKQQQQQSKR